MIPLLAGTDEAITAILDAAAAEIPSDTTQQRAEIAARLRKTADEIRANNGVALYVPIAKVHDLIVPASFAVFDLAFGSVETFDPALLTGLLAGGPEARQVGLAGVVGTRTERASPADPGRGLPVPSRRVDYLLPFPEDPDRWVLITFSALETDGHVADWVALFDAMMATFRWQQPISGARAVVEG
jgi:hypothetical protein